MSENNASHVLAAPSLFARQLARATRAQGGIDLDALAGQVTSAYDELERSRRGTDDRNALISREFATLNANLERGVAELEAQNIRFGLALENMAQGLCVFDGAQRLIVCNKQFADIYGLKPEHVRPGTTFREIVAHRYAADSSPAMNQAEYLNWWERKRVSAVADETLVELRNGRVISIRDQPMPDGGWVATHDDIPERRTVEKRLAYMAHHDDLTGLANRVLLRQRLDEALTRARRGAAFAVLCVDLDHFKVVNDTLGHTMGDALLRAATVRMRQHLRDTDTLARLGSDEFAIVQCDMDQPVDATALAERLVRILAVPFDLDGQQAVIGASIGIAVTPGDGTDPDALLRNADRALTRAKADGRGCFRFFESGMDTVMQARRSLELDLRDAAARNAFHLHYQPLMSLRARRVGGFEALLRWNHPVRGNVPPAEFIPLAEEIGLITPIGAWVLHQACAQAATWPEGICVAVNISAVQFRGGALVETVASALRQSGLPACRLELEITESVMIENGEATLAMLRELRSTGVRIAMDDFGTGYSSLSSLRNFPFDKVKIDQSFVRELTDRPDCIAIVRAVTGICASLGMTTTAEGVETREQLAMLAAERCTDVQGYLFSRPCAAADLPDLLRTLHPAGPASPWPAP